MLDIAAERRIKLFRTDQANLRATELLWVAIRHSRDLPELQGL